MPILKGAYVQESVYVGENQLDVLVTIKSKNELLGEVIGLLQSPIKTYWVAYNRVVLSFMEY
jgi:large subunit ribosomal protein L10